MGAGAGNLDIHEPLKNGYLRIVSLLRCLVRHPLHRKANTYLPTIPQEHHSMAPKLRERINSPVKLNNQVAEHAKLQCGKRQTWMCVSRMKARAQFSSIVRAHPIGRQQAEPFRKKTDYPHHHAKHYASGEWINHGHHAKVSESEIRG